MLLVREKASNEFYLMGWKGMQNVQSYVCSLNEEKLIEAYTRRYPVRFEHIHKKYYDNTVKEIIDKRRQKLLDYVKRLRNLEISKDEDSEFRGVFYAHKKQGGEGNYTLVTELMNLNEYLEIGDKAQDYGYIVTGQSVVLGYEVSEADYTQRHIYDVIADIMHEISWFGYEEERLEEMRKSLLNPEYENETEEDEADLSDSDIKIMMKEYEKEYNAENTKEEEELRLAVVEASNRYFEYSKKLERQSLIESLQ